MFIFCLLAYGTFVVWRLAFSNDLFQSNGKALSVNLRQGPFPLIVFPSKEARTRAIIIFGSGDGGWSTLEEAIGLACQNQGYELVGIDSEAYAGRDYDLETLQSDYRTIADQIRSTFNPQAPPLIVGGYSMGAAQAVAAAGGPHPPKGLIGLVVIDMLARGRYGLHTTDQMNVLPTGPGTFGVQDFAQTMSHLRVVQWHAQEDSIDSLEWLNLLTAPHEEFTFPGVGHGYRDNRDDFIRQFVDSIGWIVDHQPPTSSASTTTSRNE